MTVTDSSTQFSEKSKVTHHGLWLKVHGFTRSTTTLAPFAGPLFAFFAAVYALPVLPAHGHKKFVIWCNSLTRWYSLEKSLHWLNSATASLIWKENYPISSYPFMNSTLQHQPGSGLEGRVVAFRVVGSRALRAENESQTSGAHPTKLLLFILYFVEFLVLYHQYPHY